MRLQFLQLGFGELSLNWKFGEEFGGEAAQDSGWHPSSRRRESSQHLEILI